MGKTNDWGVTREREGGGRGQQGEEEGAVETGPMAYRRFPLPVIYAMVPNKVN